MTAFPLKRGLSKSLHDDRKSVPATLLRSSFLTQHVTVHTRPLAPSVHASRLRPPGLSPHNHAQKKHTLPLASSAFVLQPSPKAASAVSRDPTPAPAGTPQGPHSKSMHSSYMPTPTQTPPLAACLAADSHSVTYAQCDVCSGMQTVYAHAQSRRHGTREITSSKRGVPSDQQPPVQAAQGGFRTLCESATPLSQRHRQSVTVTAPHGQSQHTARQQPQPLLLTLRRRHSD